MADQIVLDIAIILFPTVVQQIFFSRKTIRNSLKYQIFIGLLYATAVVLCMKFPVNAVVWFNWDYRCIPIIIGILYSQGKYLPGFIALVTAFMYGWYQDAHMQELSIIIMILITIPCFFLAKSFHTYRSLKRFLISVSLAALTSVVISAVLFIYIVFFNAELVPSLEFYRFIGLIGMINVAGVGLLAIINEYILENYTIRIELERAEKLKIVSQLAASVAHEVRNPLTVVKGFLQLLSESVDDKKKNYLLIALSELDRAEYIITDYLNLAKPHIDHLEAIEVPSFLSSTLGIMHSYGVIQDVDLQLNCSQKDLYVLADKPKLSQVIINLIKNGVEAIPDKGEVILNAYRLNNEIIIEIIDNGRGMSKNELDSIGTAFFTTKPSGTGLGTLVTYRLVQAMDGKISFESKVGYGTKVTIRLPAVKQNK